MMVVGVGEDEVLLLDVDVVWIFSFEDGQNRMTCSSGSMLVRDCICRRNKSSWLLIWI